MRIINYHHDKEAINELLKRRNAILQECLTDVVKIIEDVKLYGDDALLRYTKEFDGVELKKEELKVLSSVLRSCYESLDKDVCKAINWLIEQVRYCAKKQRVEDILLMKDGYIIGQIFKPIESIGVYVPAREATLVSSLVMCVVPAQVAGVREIHIFCPPTQNKLPNPFILAAAHILDVDNVWCVGGVQALAACAYGTQTIPKVKKIVGPGSKYVTAAKRWLYGDVGIDLLAGPTELIVLADESTAPQAVAQQLCIQAEHSSESICGLVTYCKDLIDPVLRELQDYANKQPRSVTIHNALNKWGFIVYVETLDECIDFINSFAPEHLTLQINSPWNYIDRLHSVGCISIGKETSTASADYGVAFNHILPTAGTAAFSSGLGVSDFLRSTYIVYRVTEGEDKTYEYRKILAQLEGLETHATI